MKKVLVMLLLAASTAHASPSVERQLAKNAETYLSAEVAKLKRHGVESSWQSIAVCHEYAETYDMIGQMQYKRGIGHVAYGGLPQTEQQAAYTVANGAFHNCMQVMYSRDLMPQMIDMDYQRK